ncbi:MAG: phospholipid N-methyltransferase [Saprospiraceae bacterium]|jgi:phospholipid N-methyltransferase
MIKSKLKTAVEFAKSLRTSGALYETSRKVEIEITSHISDKPNQVYIEFGLGHGNITREILSKMHESSVLYSFEVNEDFCNHVKEEIKDKRLRIINDSAERLGDHVDQQVSGIVSSLPLTIIPKEMRYVILDVTFKILEAGGYYSQILYSKRMLKRFIKIFDEVNVIKNINIPMEYIHHCRKTNEPV